MPSLETLLDPQATRRLTPREFDSPVEPWATAAGRLQDLGVEPHRPVRAFFVPGRIEVLGKHTDYAGGRSLTAATRQGLYLVAAGRRDRRLRLHAGRPRIADLDLAGDLAPAPGRWTGYPLAVARRMRSDFVPRLQGADVAVATTLPAAAGLSSSSALVVGCWLALATLNRPEERAAYRDEIAGPEELAEYLGSVEAGQPYGSLAAGEGVGTFGGSEDHTAMLCSRAGRLSLYSYGPVRLEERIELPANRVFVIAVSGVEAAKTGTARDAYNRASLAVAELAARWRRRTGRDAPHLAAILARGPSAAEELRLIARAGGGNFTAGELERRLDHFLAESCQLVPAAARALTSGDLAELGGLADRSQRLAEELLDNQTPETVHLARSARAMGADAASAFGAGFGGAVWALVAAAEAAEFAGNWLADYHRQFPDRVSARTCLSRPAAAAFEL